MASLEKRVEKLEAVQGGGSYCRCPSSHVIFYGLDDEPEPPDPGPVCKWCGKPIEPGTVTVVHFTDTSDASYGGNDAAPEQQGANHGQS
jgi:hypothetical protein